ncbi:WRKY transcription factor 30 [Pyrus ussuriensis x Pyrus communis]|uniref:WRKY transcription factor 30 n=1 Tax=Pyrus ussuriensis x Pyrus communis TaxID=2448454 RepID=A0A5N5FLI1_9ROSA|nr:WRKY transcription factor 30 [Pyrus ussuriensis x Pyrus communis]
MGISLEILSADFYLAKASLWCNFFCRLLPQWILLLANLDLEIMSDAFDQVSSPRKPHYALIGMLLAIVAVLACISELLHNGIKERVVLRRRGMLWCFNYPPPNNLLFGTFPEIFGLGLAIVQCMCSAVQC